VSSSVSIGLESKRRRQDRDARDFPSGAAHERAQEMGPSHAENFRKNPPSPLSKNRREKAHCSKTGVIGGSTS
jgi:hypothetical protein